MIMKGCYYDIESDLYQGTNCEAATTTSFTDVITILNKYCNSCHSGTSASGGIRLDQYNYVKTYVDNGKLMGSIKWTSGYSPMPQNSSKLSTCDIDKIQAWITAGALNN